MPKSTPPTAFIAMQLTGDIGDITFVQKNSGHRYSYAKTWPRSRTPKQAERRDAFRDAQHSWQALTDTQKYTLERIARHYNMPMSGYNLWISCTLNHKLDWITDWARKLDLKWE